MAYDVPDYAFIGKVAVTELRAKGLSVSPDDAGMGAKYAERAYAEMKEAYTYDPFTQKPLLAERAAVEYVKARLRGMSPQGTDEFVMAVRSWTSRAATEQHRAVLESMRDDACLGTRQSAPPCPPDDDIRVTTSTTQPPNPDGGDFWIIPD